MLLDLIGFFVCLAPVVALLGWRLAVDHRELTAGVVRADIHAGVIHALGGETFLAIDVCTPLLWRRGHVRLSAPAGYEGLIGAVAPTVFNRLPAHYDVVIHCRGGA
jgi:hypothetical protein